MQRKRSLKFWSDHQTYQNVDEFISRVPVSGVHCVRRGNQFLDLLYLNRHAKTTLIVFHASLSKRASTVPRLEGARLAEDTGCNLIAVADPTVGLGDIDLAWFLGNRGVGKLTDCFTPLIQHCLNHAESERTILYGPSGGGFAAANFGQFFPGSIVLGVNPRLDLFSPPDADISRYLTVAHRVEGLTPRKRIAKEFVAPPIAEMYPNGLPFDFCIFQNLGDFNFIDKQLLPFIRKKAEDPRLYTRVEFTGFGHVPVPGILLRAIVSCLSADVPQEQAILGAGFRRTLHGY